jgi:hypothetical protein
MSKTLTEAEITMISRRAEARQRATDTLQRDLPRWLPGLFVGAGLLVPILGDRILLVPNQASSLLIALTVIVAIIEIDGILLRRKVAALIVPLQQMDDEPTGQAPDGE